MNVAIPEALRWTDERRGEVYELTTLNVRVLPDGSLAAKAYGRPLSGGRGGYTAFSVPDRDDLRELVDRAATEAARLWSNSTGLP